MAITGSGIPPKRLLTFVELRWFTDDWKRLKLTTDDLLVLQNSIMDDPTRPPVIPGTGGMRKIRFAPPQWKTGKSGALRVCYAFFDEFSKVLLSLVYPKSEKDNLSQHEKRLVRELLAEAEKEFARQSPR